MTSLSPADAHRLLERVFRARRANAWREIIDVAGDIVPVDAVNDQIADATLCSAS